MNSEIHRFIHCFLTGHCDVQELNSFNFFKESFGFDRIEVRDNGCGVNLNEVQYMALSHYTSKISCQSDLEHIATYGFRGQALSAICNVGQVTISTKSCEELGATYQLDCEGKIISHSPCSLNQGNYECTIDCQMVLKHSSSSEET